MAIIIDAKRRHDILTIIIVTLAKGEPMASARNEERASMEEIEAMPALLTWKELTRITGWSRVHVAKECREGILAGKAVKAGNMWQVNKAKALEALGLA